jgi:NAD(P)-dependent dehydrogenase (short-subunit alcohol dehydrogenase family)
VPASHRLITTRFDGASTADNVVAGLDLTGVRAVVTGASSGIGVETARSLARAGAEVTLAVRDTGAGRRTAEDIAESTGNDTVHVSALDLLDRSSIAEFTDRWTGPLHILINNAGIAAVVPEPAHTGATVTDLIRTPEGWELQFATNHLGHFALSLGLHDALAAGAREHGQARIVSVSSTAHMRSPVVFDDIHFERREYDPQAAYAQSKTANSLFAVEATRRWATDGIVANTVNPGGVATGLQRGFTQKQKDYLAAAEASGVFTYKTTQQGAATTLVAALAPELAHTGGHYLDDGREAYTVTNDADLFDHAHGVKQWALDPDTARKLWTVSLDLIDQPATHETPTS